MTGGSAIGGGCQATVIVRDHLFYAPNAFTPDGDGLGMNLVDRRIKIRYGAAYGIRVQCEAEHWTRVTIALPTAEETVPC